MVFAVKGIDMTLGYFLQFLIRYFSEKRWANFCESVPRDFAFPQWAHVRIFLPETLPKSPSQTFLGQCVMLSWVKERTISRCLLSMLKSWIRTQKKNPRPKCILILHNYQFCRALNKTIVFLVKHLSGMYDDKVYLFQTAKVYLETTWQAYITFCYVYLQTFYMQSMCNVNAKFLENISSTKLQVYLIRVIYVNCFCVCAWKKLHLQQSCVIQNRKHAMSRMYCNSYFHVTDNGIFVLKV